MERSCQVLEISRTSYYVWQHRAFYTGERSSEVFRQGLVKLRQKHPALGVGNRYQPTTHVGV